MGKAQSMIRLIAAVDSRLGIATESGIPWHLPGDIAYFREKTSVGTILMGRGTYDELAAPFHNRENFVLTSSQKHLRPGFERVADVAAFFEAHGGEDIWVIGGAGVFSLTLSRADQLLLTRVTGDFHCTKFFPPFEGDFVRISRSDEHEENRTRYRFETWGPR
jgi:dihydrofolate reductase